MAAGRFRPPKSHAPAQRRQPRPGFGRRFFALDGVEFEREPDPVLRVSLTGIRNMLRGQREALRKERAADPAGTGVHSWRRRQWGAV